MTSLRYSKSDCAEGSQVLGIAPSSDAWNVNLNNGNANINNQNNSGRVLACRRAAPPRECQGVTFRALFDAWQQARRQKVPSENQLSFEADWIDELLSIQRQINAGTWKPRSTTCFIATRPKAREIHAPDFADRVVHHWLVPQLEAVWESRFIHHSYANRRGKGSHAAVDALHTMVRQVASGQSGGWYLQLDVRNFFNSIHRPTLYAKLKAGMERAALPVAVRRVTHALLRHSVDRQGVIYACTEAERERVPAYKRLENAPAGCGLPIGNLSSQLFANIYLDRLDQFVKHELKARRYVRYVDDFILIHRDRDVLAAWQARIAEFLASELQLRLKDDIRLRPLADGIDFLGYVILPTHTLVRRRVVSYLRTALADWERAHVARGLIRATPQDLRCIRSIAASYSGHLRHANSRRLQSKLQQRFPWLSTATRLRRFHHDAEGHRITLRIPNAGSN